MRRKNIFSSRLCIEKTNMELICSDCNDTFTMHFIEQFLYKFYKKKYDVKDIYIYSSDLK